MFMNRSVRVPRLMVTVCGESIACKLDYPRVCTSFLRLRAKVQVVKPLQ